MPRFLLAAVLLIAFAPAINAEPIAFHSFGNLHGSLGGTDFVPHSQSYADLQAVTDGSWSIAGGVEALPSFSRGHLTQTVTDNALVASGALDVLLLIPRPGAGAASSSAIYDVSYELLEPMTYVFHSLIWGHGDTDTGGGGVTFRFDAIESFTFQGPGGINVPMTGTLMAGFHQIHVSMFGDQFETGFASSTGGRHEANDRFAFDLTLAPVDVQAVPEPTSMLLVATGLLGVWRHAHSRHTD